MINSLAYFPGDGTPNASPTTNTAPTLQNFCSLNSVLNAATMKDSRWLTLEVCRQFQRNACTRDETECKFAHPPPHVDVQYGRVMCCYDSIKGKCQRREPPCKYLHPPQHLREQLLQNGRNNLIWKSTQLQLIQQQLLGAVQQAPPPPSTGQAPPQTRQGALSPFQPPPPPPPQHPPVSSAAHHHHHHHQTSPNQFLNLLSTHSAATATPIPPLLDISMMNYLMGISDFNVATQLYNQYPVTGTTQQQGLLNNNPAKRPALADLKSGLPIFSTADLDPISSNSVSSSSTSSNCSTAKLADNISAPLHTFHNSAIFDNLATQHVLNEINLMNAAAMVTSQPYYNRANCYPLEMTPINFQQ